MQDSTETREQLWEPPWLNKLYATRRLFTCRQHLPYSHLTDNLSIYAHQLRYLHIMMRTKQSKLLRGDWKCGSGKCDTGKIARVENEGVENAGVEKARVDSRGGKCRSKSYGTPARDYIEKPQVTSLDLSLFFWLNKVRLVRTSRTAQTVSPYTQGCGVGIPLSPGSCPES